MVGPIDLRSDTVTRPSRGMLAAGAAAAARITDCTLESDIILNQWQTVLEATFKKGAALFVPTATMANLIAGTLLAKPHAAMAAGHRSHIWQWEIGGFQLLGIPVQCVENLSDGTVSLPLQSGDELCSSLALECTHNDCGGVPITQSFFRSVAETHPALPIHLDGTRIFDAAQALGAPPAEITKHAYSVTVCFSKSLGCPAGAALLGPRDFIDEASQMRDRLGGTIRKAGILAAYALHAIEFNVPQLERTHEFAFQIAQAFVSKGYDVVYGGTNMVYIVNTVASELKQRLSNLGVIADSAGRDRVRLVSHIDLGLGARNTVLDAVRSL